MFEEINIKPDINNVSYIHNCYMVPYQYVHFYVLCVSCR